MFGFVRAAGLGAVAALSILATTQASSAAVIYASSVDSITPGLNVAPPRNVSAAALGAPDGKFLSLGLGGSATFGFGSRFTSPGTIIEVTFGSRARFIETADVYGINGAVETLIGQVVNITGNVALTFAGSFTQLKIVDTSSDGVNPAGWRPRDGFDIDAIAVAPVPLPAGGLLLLGALGGVAALRRRKSA